jgi:hypothetical protein
MCVFLHTENWMGNLLKRLVANTENHSTSLNLLPSFSLRCKHAFETINQAHPLRATHLTSVPSLAIFCLSDAPAHDHMGFGLPKWSMFLLALAHQHCPTCSTLSLRPKTFAEQLDKINIRDVDCTQFQNLWPRNNQRQKT